VCRPCPADLPLVADESPQSNTTGRAPTATVATPPHSSLGKYYAIPADRFLLNAGLPRVNAFAFDCVRADSAILTTKRHYLSVPPHHYTSRQVIKA